MTETETKKIIASMMATYPNYRPDDIQLAISVWTDLFAEYSYQQVSMGLKAYMQSNTSGFAPAPGQVIDLIHKITCPPELNEEEAWSLVANAIRNGIYNSVEEFEKLPPTVQRAVGQPSQLRYWAMDEDFNEGVEKANFMKVYRTEVERASEIGKMPSEVKNLIQNTAQTSQKAKLADKNASMVKSLAEEKKAEILAIMASQSHSNIPANARERVEQLLNQ